MSLHMPFDGKLFEKFVFNPLLWQCNSPLAFKTVDIYYS